MGEEEGSHSTNYGLKTSLKNHDGRSFAYFQSASHIPVLPMDARPFLLFFFSHFNFIYKGLQANSEI